ncbi:undecaprenyl-diphosphate phosphatase [Ornithinimicrobium cryptoxanthini]|uniref:Undecaprenyl-diphosphatase n=1 Tax=Ornithinimicrobium cryptoxanthini TaxID=2934161 RepID=A0ABY4YF77_9MICO|nr:undecaprenyl-diphosphate phosphatase [Ornithinimicrobium cryptoxanthini]USQ75430.1 undecaprenyl-diphosphate phosphatase [Ornithinimicrobium cryptoxanthini]
MGYLEAIVLGLVQGLTEFLPVSSSAHISIVGQLFGTGDPGAAFTAISQLGTEAAVLVFFFRDIVRIIRQWALSLTGRVPRNDPDARMGWLVIIGSIPIGVLGFTLQDYIETDLRSLWLTATMLLVFALVIFAADRFASRVSHPKELREITWRDGILYGLAQSLALVPGVSRSGGTIAAGLFMGYSRETAARYSFLLAIPAVLGSGFYQVLKISDNAVPPQWGQIWVATGIAFVVALAVIAWFMRYITTHTFTPFVIYRIALALVLFALLGTGVLVA